MSNVELKCDLALADLARDLADAHEARRKQFAAINPLKATEALTMTIPTKLSLHIVSDINLGELRHLHLRRFIFDAVRHFPDCAEGVTEFDGIQHFITYVVKGDVIEVCVAPRDYAEAILNDHGLSTVEPGLPPWPGSEH